MKELQERANAGTYGRKPGFNLHELNTREMRIELSKWGVNGTARMDKERLRQKLRSRLTGVQRVPALLAFRPMRSVDAAGLTDYTVMPTEPLHDLKGHIAHVLTEVPYHVEKDIAAKIRNITAGA